MWIVDLFGFGKNKPKVKHIDVEQAHRGTKKNGGRDGKGHRLIDVRSAAEWQQTGRPIGAYGAVLQDADFIEQVLTITEADKSAPIALICRSGARSSKAAKRLIRAGHQNVANVSGGLMAWQKAQLPLERPPFKR